MAEFSTTVEDSSYRLRRPVWKTTSWGPVFAGAVTAIGLQFVFTVLGIAIGVSAAAPTESAEIASISMTAGAWWLITGTVSLAIGGAVLGRLWGWVGNAELFLHAAALWGVVAIFGFMVIWSGVGITAGAISPLGLVAQDAPRPVGEAAVPGSADERALRAEALREAGRTAAWWSVAGLLVGLGATMGGAGVGSQTLRAGVEVPRESRKRPAAVQPAAVPSA